MPLNVSQWSHFSVGELFRIEPTKGTTTDELLAGDDIPYIAAKKDSNGFEMMCKRKGNEAFVSKGNCLVFIQLGQGSAGYVTYQEKDFIGMSGKTSCGYNKNLNKYNGVFLTAVLDLERPKFSFGRSWTGDRLTGTTIKLPALQKVDSKGQVVYVTDEEGKPIKDNGGRPIIKMVPDWRFMEDYIKSIPYSDLM